jgi:hypothetical protein
VRALLDANVLVSALISHSGAPASLLEKWLAGAFDLVVCETLLAETERTLASAKLRPRVNRDDAAAFIALIQAIADVVPDPTEPAPIRSADPDDDYLLAVAAREDVIVVTGDSHLLDLADRAPVVSPAEFLSRLD